MLWSADFGSIDADGGPGNDELHSLNGNDTLRTMDGLTGNDRADGGGGVNHCTFDVGDLISNC